MTVLTSVQKNFLDQYLKTLIDEEKSAIANLDNVAAEYFCADKMNANECARLVNVLKKTASCSLKAAWEYDDEPFPNIGALTIVTDWDEVPVCIIKTTAVTIAKFKEVTPEFAKAEGEGDGSYEWWRKAHINFFTAYANEIGCQFSEDSELVLERFIKVYPI
jgi:uncharacterized protein YhfF